MTQETGNFKSKLFGGFDRQDVINYIEVLAGERNSLREENEKLTEKVAELEARCAEFPDADDDAPSDTEGEVSSDDDAVNDTAEKCAQLIDHANEIILDIKSQYDAICGDIKINVTQAEFDMSQLAIKNKNLSDSLNAADSRFAELLAEIEKLKNPLQDTESSTDTEE
jgi:cell division septum initiation protein DivIVA